MDPKGEMLHQPPVPRFFELIRWADGYSDKQGRPGALVNNRTAIRNGVVARQCYANQYATLSAY